MIDFETALRRLRWWGVAAISALATLMLINLHPRVVDQAWLAFTTGLLMFAVVMSFIAALIELFKDEVYDEKP